MYRDFVKRLATRRGLRGTVENLADGSVRVVVQGEEVKLRAVIGSLQRGSLLSRVGSVEVKWRDQLSQLDGFRIIG